MEIEQKDVTHQVEIIENLINYVKEIEQDIDLRINTKARDFINVWADFPDEIVEDPKFKMFVTELGKKVLYGFHLMTFGTYML